MVALFWSRIKVVSLVVLILVVVHITNSVMDNQLTQFGILPRHWDTWYHIFTAPFIHGSHAHLINNLIGLTIFSGICLLSRSIGFYLVASLFIVTLTGILIWAFGRKALHIGASGWIFGLWSLTIMQAWFDRSFKHFCIAIMVVFFYGGMIYGVLPTQPGVSFEAHLFGVVAGVVFAALSAKRIYRKAV